MNRGYEIEIEDRRDEFEFEIDEIDVDYFDDRTWPKGHIHEGEPVILREYQRDIVNKFIQSTSNIQKIATGAGKTLVTATLSAMVENSYSGSGDGRTVIIVPNKSLVTQTFAEYENLGLDVGMYYGDRKDFDKKHTVCTWQSLGVMHKNFQNGDSDIGLDDFMNGVTAVICDECLDGETPILTPNGWKAVKSMEPGDAVVNWDGKKFKHDVVEKLHVNLPKSNDEDMLELEFDNGHAIRVTANHEFLTHGNGWVRADQLTEDMDIVSNPHIS